MFTIVRKKVHVILLAAIIIGIPGSFLSGESVEAAEDVNAYYVSTDGNDITGDGTESMPFKSIQKARDYVRAQTATGMTGDITVYIEGGQYYTSSTISFTEDDSGRDGYTITYKGYLNAQGEMPIINGGQAITGWIPYAGNIYKAQVGDWEFNTLSEDGVKALKARTPNYDSGNKYVKVSEEILSGSNISKSKWHFSEGDIPESVTNSPDIEAYVWGGGPDGVWNWHATLGDITDIDHANNIISMNRNAAYEMGAGSRFLIQGALPLLDQPGEFYLDSTNNDVYYWPHDVANLENGKVVAPKTTKLFEFKGSSKTEDKWIRNITIDGFDITTTDFDQVNQFYGIPMINVENASHITITNSKIHNSGSTGIAISNYGRNNTISNNLVYDNGLHGISISGAWYSSSVANGDNTITNNHVYRAGQIIGHGAGINLFQTGYNTVTYNRIHDVPRFALFLSGPSPLAVHGHLIGQVVDGVTITEANVSNYRHCIGNKIMYNDIFDSMKDSQDGAPVYSWSSGNQKGNPSEFNVISNNMVHDSNIYFSYGYAFYLDAYTDGTMVHSNLLYGHQRYDAGGGLAGVAVNKGHYNYYHNNIMADSPKAGGAIADEINDAMLNPSRYLGYLRNILYDTTRPNGSIIRTGYMNDDRWSYMDFNLYFNPSHHYAYSISQANYTVEQWRDTRELDLNTIVDEDPRFMDPGNSDYRLKYDSPAYEVGFEDIDAEAMGLNADFPYADETEDLARLFVKANGQGAGMSHVSLDVGGTTNVTVTGRTTNGYLVEDLASGGAIVTYTSSDASKALVSAEGVVTGVAKGIATITAEVVKNGKTKSISLDVRVDDAVTGIVLKAADTRLDPDQNLEILTYGMTELGANVVLAGKLNYTSSDPNVATVTQDGIVTAVGAGDAVISVSLQQNPSVSGNITLYVANSWLESVSAEANPGRVLASGESAQLQITGIMTDQTAADLTHSTIVVTSGDESIVSVISTTGAQTQLLAAAPGRTTVSISVTKDGVEKKVTLPFAVYADKESDLPAPWSLSNIGTNVHNGFADYNEADGSFAISSDGDNIWGTEDSGFTFVHQSINYDKNKKQLVISAKVDSLFNTSKSASAGVMIRDSLAANAASMNIRVQPDGSVIAVYRTQTGTYWYFVEDAAGMHGEVKIVRDGDEFTLWTKRAASSDWVKGSSITILMNDIDGVYAGMSVFSNQPGMTTDAVLSSVNIETPNITASEFLDQKVVLVPGKTHQAVVNDVESKDDVTGESTFASGNSAVATVDAAGLITAAAPGSTTITATRLGKTIEMEVIVAGNLLQAPGFEVTSLSPLWTPSGSAYGTYSIAQGEGIDGSHALKLAGNPASKVAQNFTHGVAPGKTYVLKGWGKLSEPISLQKAYFSLISYDSSNNRLSSRGFDFAEIANTTQFKEGRVEVTTPEGIAMMQASLYNASGKDLYIDNVSMVEKVFQSFDLTAIEMMETGSTQTLSVTDGKISDGSAANLTGATISYSSSNPDAASVDALTGVVTANAAGTTMITVKAVLNGLTVTETKEITVEDPEPIPAEAPDLELIFAAEGLVLSGSARITGDVGTHSIQAGSVDFAWSTGIDGDLYIGPEADWTQVVKSPRPNPASHVTGDIANLDVVRSFPLPYYPVIPELENKGNYVAGWTAGSHVLNESGAYDNITVNSQLVIDVGNEDIRIVVKDLSVTESGAITVNKTGSGKLILYVTNTLVLSGGGSINRYGDDDNVVIYYSGSNNLNFGGNTRVSGSLFARDANIEISNSGSIAGNLVTGGSSVIVDGNAKFESGVIYAPQAALTLSGSSKITGISTTRSVVLTGASEIVFDNSISLDFFKQLDWGFVTQ